MKANPFLRSFDVAMTAMSNPKFAGMPREQKRRALTAWWDALEEENLSLEHSAAQASDDEFYNQ